MRSIKDIRASITKHFVTEWGLTTPISYPGSDFDPNEVSCDGWVKIMVSEADKLPQRRGGNLTPIVILIHIYHTFSDNVYRIEELGDLVRAVFHQRDIALLSEAQILIRCKESSYVYHGQENKGKTEINDFEVASVRTEAMVE